MRPEQIEAWVLSVVERVQSRRSVEDSRVELKGDWPDPKRAARRVAGHANASGGEHILWIIGLDEERGVVPLAHTDPASWRNQLAAEFDGVSPSFVDLVVPTVNGSVVALLFDTSRRPYVVKNSAHGSPQAGPVSHEVPWREGTSLRSALRADLLKILVPLQQLPVLEPLSAYVSVQQEQIFDPAYHPNVAPVRRAPHLAWTISLDLYVTPRTPELLVIPVHKTRLRFALETQSEAAPSELRLYPPLRHTGQGFVRDSHTITTSQSEAVVEGPGKLEIRALYYESLRALPTGFALHVALTLTPAGQERSVSLSLVLKPDEAQGEYRRSWRFRPDGESA